MMKSTGIARKVDQLGRVVIPKELRKTMEIAEADPFEIYTDNELIILKKYQPGCIFCGNAEEVKDVNGKNICEACLMEMKEVM